MAHEDEDLPSDAAQAGQGSAVATLPPRRRLLRRIGLGIAALAILAIAGLWVSRVRLADRLITRELVSLGLPATYEIAEIGPRRQVLTKVVIGDPARPDLTIERVEVSLVPRLGTPGLGRVQVVRPRLHGSYRDGGLSFGSLDKLLFGARGGGKFRLPDVDLDIVDARARIDGDRGVVGVAMAGKGRLRAGFAGTLAAVAPQLEGGGCRIQSANLSGRISVSAERPRFAGPLRAASVSCPSGRLQIANVSLATDINGDAALDGLDGALRLHTGALSSAALRMASTHGGARVSWRGGALTARYTIAADDLAHAAVASRTLALEGVLRADDSLSRITTEGSVDARGLVPSAGLDAALGSAMRSASGSFAAPLLAQLREALRREGPGSRLAGEYLLRRGGGRLGLVAPRLNWRGGGGETLLTASRLWVDLAGAGPPRVTGDVETGGPGLPRIVGRIEHGPGGPAIRLTMAEYRAGASRLAIPRLSINQGPGGALGFAGEARISGPLPGGEARGLVLPIAGGWSRGAGLTLWRSCATFAFARLRYANLTLDGRSLTLCPPRGDAMVRSGSGGLRVGAGAPSLAVTGRLGATPIRIASGPIAFAAPGVLKARALDVALGPVATQSRFRLANLDARIGRDVSGAFSGSDISLAAVPLDLAGAAGRWRYAGGRLTIVDAAFQLRDRQAEPRFRPLVARGASLALADNRITADALLREPASDRAVVAAHIIHDLSGGTGRADLAVTNLRFDKRLQPAALTPLALGVIANANGAVSGSGRIDWNPRAVTSTGSFTTDGLDFAAAFGPVSGLSGTVRFTDLLGLVTAPHQMLAVGSINPGIEVTDGALTFALQPGRVLAIEGGRWPFMDGTLMLEPTALTLGAAETRRFTLAIEGLNAARLVERVGFANLSATGTFDGRMPLVFDASGGRIEGGALQSRAPGGNVSYVGALTYKDLSAMANFAFDALKSLDYRTMTIAMDGALAGELVTRVRFSGVTQGLGAKRNFLTDRIGRLPIQFNVNLRAPFFQLISSVKSLYDPAYVRDPRDVGLLGPDGKPVAVPQIQPPASGSVR